MSASEEVRLELDHMTRAIIELSLQLKDRDMEQRAVNYGIVKGYLIGVSAPKAILEAFEAAISAPSSDRIEITGTVPPMTLPVELAPSPLPDVRQEAVAKLLADEQSVAGETTLPPAGEMEDEGRGWPQWKKEKLIEMKAAGKKPKEIAAALGKKPSQVSWMWHYLQTHRRDEATVQPKAGEPVSNYDPDMDEDAIGKGSPAKDSPKQGPSATPRKGWRKGQSFFVPPPTPTLKGETTTYTDEQGRKVTRVPPGYAIGATPSHTVMPLARSGSGAV